MGGGRRFLDPQLRQAGLDGGGHAAKRLDLLDMGRGPRYQTLGQLLKKIGAAERVDDMRHVRLVLQMDLCVARNPRRMVGRQAQRLVERIGVQRLGMAGDSGAALDAGTGDIVEHILRRQRPARCLAMGAQHQ